MAKTLVPTRIEQAEHRQLAGNADVLLYQHGIDYVAFRRDAEACQRYAMPEIAFDDPTVCVIPGGQREQAIHRLVAAGYRVAVLEQVT